MRVVAILLVVLIVVSFSWASSPEQETTETALSWTFEKVGYNSDKKVSKWKPFEKKGTLTINEEGLEFRSGDFELQIPAVDIRYVTVDAGWITVEATIDGEALVVWFQDARPIAIHRETEAIHDAIQQVMRMARGEDPAIPPPVSSAATVGGQSVATMDRKQFKQEARKGYPDAPKTLLADPARVGILLIDGDIKSGLLPWQFDGIGLVRTDDETRLFKGGPMGGQRFLRGPKFSGVVIFTGLEPGEYGVRIVRGAGTDTSLTLEMPPHPDLTFRVEAGRVHYHGPFRIKGRGRGKTVIPKSDPARRAQILDGFAEKYAGSPWAALALAEK